MRILLPVDGSEHCRNALRFIASRQALSPEKEATVELLNVQHSIPEAVINALGLDSVRKASQDEGKLDMLVIGSHGYGNFRAAFMGSTAMRITAGCEVPLLVLKA